MWIRRVGSLSLVLWSLSMWMRSELAEASCSAPTKCEIDEVEVLSCTLADPDKDPKVTRFAESMKKSNPELSKHVREAYRGVFIEVQQKTTRFVDCKRGLDKKLYDESAYKLTGGGLAPSEAVKAGRHRWFFPTKKDVCAERFPEKRSLRMTAAFSCCDGDPNVPCLLARD
jgi:hypothetical protein